jgi:DNA-binding CsgD family transcriptional regulator
MGMAQLVVTAVLVEGRSKSEVARTYGVSRRSVDGPCYPCFDALTPSELKVIRLVADGLDE